MGLVQPNWIDEAKLMGDPAPLDLDCRRLLTLVRRLHLLKQIGVIAFFDTQDVVQIVLGSVSRYAGH